MSTKRRTLRTVMIPLDTVDLLKPAADARGMDLPTFIRAVLATVARDDLVSAVLDDGVKVE